MNKQDEEIKKLRHRQTLILLALKNILEQNNKKGINDYLISVMDGELNGQPKYKKCCICKRRRKDVKWKCGIDYYCNDCW